MEYHLSSVINIDMAQSLISTPKINTFFRDISLAFTPNPITGDLVVRTDIDAIKDSVRNLVLLNSGEVPFSSAIGGNAYHMLFSNFTLASRAVFEAQILDTLKKYEKRIDGVKVNIARLSENTISITVGFTIVGSSETQTLTVSVTRNH